MAADTADSAGPQYPIASVDNALRLLLLVKDADGIRLSEAARALGVANSTAHRLLAMLQHRGFVEQDVATKLYTAGPTLVDIGLRAAGRLGIRELAHDELVDLAASLGETVHLAVLVDTDVRYVDSVEGPRALRVALRTGVTQPAHATATGKALLAELPDAELRSRFRNRKLAAVTPRTVTSIKGLVEQLAVVRTRGYSVSEGESDEHMTSLAVAIRSRTGSVAGAISVAAPADRLPRARHGEVAAALQAAAERISARMAD